MLVKGHWVEFDDGGIRPVIEAEVELANGEWIPVRFLLDGGSDKTIFAASWLPVLRPLLVSDDRGLLLGGIGGNAGSLLLEAQIGLFRQDGKRVTIRGEYGIFTELATSDICILGRDVTNNFDVIYSFDKREVLLLAKPHTYVVQEPF